MRYTSEEFAHAAKSYKHSHYADESVIMAALRIASRVMAEGVIEREMYDRLDETAAGVDELAAAIRAALLEDAGA